MREIDSLRRGKIHKYLLTDKVKKAFKQNTIDEEHSTRTDYSDGKSDKIDGLKWTLKHIYYEKCAFCESYIKNDFGEIEHYRPKNRSEKKFENCDKRYSYYWLAFSWDNLLPACKRCNGKKSNCFDIEGDRVDYKSEKLDDLHNNLETYNQIEQPKLLHPEFDIFEDYFRFTKYGEIESKDERVNYTVIICDLNRKNLVNSRKRIITEFIEELREECLFCDYDEDKLSISLRSIIKNFCKYSSIEYQYSLVYKYIRDNFEEFLDEEFNNEENTKYIILIAFLTFCEEN